MIKIDKENKNILNGWTFLDLFSGIGSFHIALSSFGASCIGASEIKESAIRVYSNNFSVPYIKDIKDIKDKRKVDIITAGFPCQPFSVSGKQKGLEDDRGKLFFEIVRLARLNKPKIILLENVANLEKHNSGRTYTTIKDSLYKAGYNVFSKVLNASEFGVPQSRKRIYILAFHETMKIDKFNFPISTNQKSSLDQLLETQIDDSLIINRSYQLIDDLDNVVSQNRTIRIGQINQGRQGERIYSTKGHSITLSASGGGLGGKTGIYHVNGFIRKLSVRECARVMGFPEKYSIKDITSNTGYELFGNTIVVDMLQLIMLKVIEKLIEIGELKKNG